MAVQSIADGIDVDSAGNRDFGPVDNDRSAVFSSVKFEVDVRADASNEPELPESCSWDGWKEKEDERHE